MCIWQNTRSSALYQIRYTITSEIKFSSDIRIMFSHLVHVVYLQSHRMLLSEIKFRRIQLKENQSSFSPNSKATIPATPGSKIDTYVALKSFPITRLPCILEFFHHSKIFHTIYECHFPPYEYLNSYYISLVSTTIQLLSILNIQNISTTPFSCPNPHFQQLSSVTKNTRNNL